MWEKFKLLLSPKKVDKQVAKIRKEGDDKLDEANKKADKFEITLRETKTIKIATAVGANRGRY